MSKDDLMTPEEVAAEIVENLNEELQKTVNAAEMAQNNQIPDLEQEKYQVIAESRTFAHNVSFTAYNTHLALTGEPLPISNLNDLQDSEKRRQLSEWLERHYPGYN